MLIAIIQARLASTRLPGKVLKTVNGRTLFSYLLERLRRCRLQQRIILATTVNPLDDRLVAEAEKEGIGVYRGSEADVLDRYYQAASQFQANAIMRMTGDCPLLDPGVCDAVASRYLEGDVDYAYTGPRFCEGIDCEVFSLEALERAAKRTMKKTEREHVTLYFRRHPQEFRQAMLENTTDDSKYRLTVDSPEDFEVTAAIFKNFSTPIGRDFRTEEIKRFLDRHPNIFNINAHIIRNEGLLISEREDA